MTKVPLAKHDDMIQAIPYIIGSLRCRGLGGQEEAPNICNVN